MTDTASTPPVVAFDFDGTLSRGDSLQDFAAYTIGRLKRTAAYLRVTPAALRWGMGIGHTRESVKCAFLQACWRNAPRAWLEEQATHYAATRLRRRLHPEMLARLETHQARGHRVVLVSASPALYLKPWAQSAGFETVLATELDFTQDVFQGRLATPNCWGPEKVVRLAQWLGDPDFRLAYAYGDSRGDTEMLARAELPWLRGTSQALPLLNGVHRTPPA